PPAVLLAIRLVLAPQLLADLVEVDIADPLLLDLQDLVERRLAQLVGVVGVAAEEDVEAAAVRRLARDPRTRRHAVAPAETLAQHLAQPDIEHHREDRRVALGLAAPRAGAVHPDRHEALGLGAGHDLLHDLRGRIPHADVLPLLLAPLRRQAAEVRL